jgi:hypothetical protein
LGDSDVHPRPPCTGRGGMKSKTPWESGGRAENEKRAPWRICPGARDSLELSIRRVLRPRVSALAFPFCAGRVASW